MNPNAPQSQIVSSPDDSRLLSKWTRRYSQNRTAPMLVNLGVLMLISMPWYILPTFASTLQKSGNEMASNILFLGLVGYFPIFIVLVTLLSIPKFAVPLQHRLEAYLHSATGIVTLRSENERHDGKRLSYIVGVLFITCVLYSVIASFLGYYQEENMQPISALYCVPFILYLYWRQRPLHSPFLLIWPIMYGLHAFLLVMGTPILFHAPWNWLNMMLPIFGYGCIAGLVSLVYSRFALTQVKRLAREGLTDE